MSTKFPNYTEPTQTVFEIETAFGKLKVTALGADRVRVEGGWVWNVEGVEGADGGLTINGVRYGVSGFLWRHEDGSWQHRNRDDETHGADLSIDRRMHDERNRFKAGDDYSQSALVKARVIVADAVQAWSATPEAAAALNAADEKERSNQIKGAREQRARAEDYIRQLDEIIATNESGEYRSQFDHSYEVLYEDRNKR